MVKVAHAVNPVMAAGAVHAIVFHMGSHVVMVVFDMAAQAIQRISRKAILAVAAFTAHGVALVVLLVFDQAEVRQFGMIDVGERRNP